MTPEDAADLRDALTQRSPPSEELPALTRELSDRAQRRDGHKPKPQDFPDAKPHECLDNAIAWVKANPGSSLVYGFLYHDYEFALPHVRFVPHVTVLTAEGTLVDVTLQQPGALFLQHRGTEQTFVAALAHGEMNLVYR